MFPFLIVAFVLAVLPVSASPHAMPAPLADGAADPAAAPAPSWMSRVNTGPAGSFPPPRSFTASYLITWSDVEAGQVEAKCFSPVGGAVIHTAIKAASTGGARLLYKMDATGTCVADRRTLRPVRFEQRQEASGKHTYTKVDFTPREAVRSNADPTAATVDPAKAVPRHFPYPGMFDMHSALLYLRSLPLADGDEKTFPVMASNTPYLVTIKVLDHERVKTRAGEYPAVMFSLALQKINKLGELEAHKSFKSARAWISDDADRLLLKIETEILVGSVNLELEKVTF